MTADGKRAVSASRDNTLKVWDLENGREMYTLEGHSSWVWGVALSPDGARVASASADNSVRIWETERGRELITLVGHPNGVHSVTWSPDGKMLLSGGNDGIIQVYSLDLDSLMSLARSRVTRNLTREECRTFSTATTSDPSREGRARMLGAP